MKASLALALVGPTLKKLIELAELALPGATGAEKKKWVVETLNARFDLPLLNEEQEEALFGFGFDLIVGLVKS